MQIQMVITNPITAICCALLRINLKGICFICANISVIK